jgi:hypothetical protein
MPGACFTGETPSMSEQQRVESFIQDFHRAHTKFMASHDESADKDREFRRWNAVLARLEARHFIAGGARSFSGVLHGESPHDPSREKVIGRIRRGDLLFVETRIQASLAKYYEYEMRQINGDWRIARVREYLDASSEPFMNDKQRASFSQVYNRPLRPMPKNQAGFDGTAMFEAGRRVTVDGESTVIEVKPLGVLNASTGILVLGDFGYDPQTLAPLALRVAPGRYPVDIVIGFKRVGGIRVKFSSQPVVKWHPADMSDHNHLLGVDAGNVSVSDVSSLLTVGGRDKERAFESFTESGQEPLARMLSLVNTDDLAITETGHGDGTYPAYWGVDAAGKPVQLIVDFFVVTPFPAEEGDGE